MDVHTLNTFLRPILTVTSVWNTGETGDIHSTGLLRKVYWICPIKPALFDRNSENDVNRLYNKFGLNRMARHSLQY